MNAQEINALPLPVREYIHNLEARCDPAGDVQKMACMQEQIDELLFKDSSYFTLLQKLKELSKSNELDPDAFDYWLRIHNVEI